MIHKINELGLILAKNQIIYKNMIIEKDVDEKRLFFYFECTKTNFNYVWQSNDNNF